MEIVNIYKKDNSFLGIIIKIHNAVDMIVNQC